MENKIAYEDYHEFLSNLITSINAMCDEAYAAEVDAVSVEVLVNVIEKVKETIDNFETITQQLHGGQLETVMVEKDGIDYIEELLPKLEEKLKVLNKKP